MIERSSDIEFHDERIVDACRDVGCQVEFKQHTKQDGKEKCCIDDKEAVPLREKFRHVGLEGCARSVRSFEATMDYRPWTSARMKMGAPIPIYIPDQNVLR